MRFDLRAFIVALWITVGMTTITSDFVFGEYDIPDPDNRNPAALTVEHNSLDTLSEAIPLLYGFWGAAVLSGLVVGVSGLPLNVSIANTLGGYWAAALIRLAFLKQFIPGTNHAWTLLADLFQLKSLPEYHLFLLLVLLGGSLFVGIAVMLADTLRRQNDLRWIEPEEPVLLRPIVTAIFTPMLLIFTVITIYTLVERVEIPPHEIQEQHEAGITSDQQYEAIKRKMVDALLLNKLEWVVQPVPNMLMVALSGALVGLGYMTPSRESAAKTVLLGAMAYVTMMVLVDVVAGFYGFRLISVNDLITDVEIGRGTGSGINYNYLGQMRAAFSAFWFWVPAVGALSAFAMHNLRDAFTIQPAAPEMLEPVS